MAKKTGQTGKLNLQIQTIDTIADGIAEKIVASKRYKAAKWGLGGKRRVLVVKDGRDLGYVELNPIPDTDGEVVTSIEMRDEAHRHAISRMIFTPDRPAAPKAPPANTGEAGKE